MYRVRYETTTETGSWVSKEYSNLTKEDATRIAFELNNRRNVRAVRIEIM